MTSPPRLPPQSILHRENIPNPPLDRGSLYFVAFFLSSIVFLLGAIFAAFGLIGL
jgi:hypothetical protein